MGGSAALALATPEISDAASTQRRARSRIRASMPHPTTLTQESLSYSDTGLAEKGKSCARSELEDQRELQPAGAPDEGAARTREPGLQGTERGAVHGARAVRDRRSARPL